MTTEKTWAEMTPEEKREERFARWLSPPDVKFASVGAEAAYKTRVERFIKVIKLEEPDRVPVMLPAGNFAASYGKSSFGTVMYDYDELRRTWLKFLNDFDLDTFGAPALVYPGKVFDMLDYKLMHWPGHGLAADAPSYQYVEGEYMFPEEYDALIKDPFDYLVRTWLPRTAGAFGGFKKLGPMPLIENLPVFYITQFADPEVRASVMALLDAAEEGEMAQGRRRCEPGSAGSRRTIPVRRGAAHPSIFSVIRSGGPKGSSMDMYRRPDKLLEAIEVVTPIIIDRTVGSASAAGSPVVTFTLHKGPGGFMSGNSSRLSAGRVSRK